MIQHHQTETDLTSSLLTRSKSVSVQHIYLWRHTIHLFHCKTLTKSIKPFKTWNHMFVATFEFLYEVAELCWPHSHWPIRWCWNEQSIFHLKVKTTKSSFTSSQVNRRTENGETVETLDCYLMRRKCSFFAQLGNNWCWEVTLNPDIFWEVRD